MAGEKEVGKTRNRSIWSAYPSARKEMAAFRMPEPLLEEVKGEAKALGMDFTTFLNRLVDAYLRYFALPRMVCEALEEDRAALKLNRLEYLQYLCFQRYKLTEVHGSGSSGDSVGKGRK